MRWQALRKRTLAAWRAEHGEVCPGWRRPPHRASDLTVDHVIPLVRGGQPFDPANVTVLCRSCNGRKGLAQRPRRRRVAR